MKIVVFGSTGSVGQHIVKQAIQKNYQVVAFARHPENLNISNNLLRLYSGDVYDTKAVNEAITGCDAVLITLGSSKLSGNLRSKGTQHIVDAMEQQGIKRLICQTTLGMGDSYSNLNFFWKYIMFGFILKKVFQDHAKQEAIVKKSSLDWTLVRPSSFTDDVAKGRPKKTKDQQQNYQYGFPPTAKNLTLKVLRSDVADFMLKQLVDETFIKKAPGISN